MQTATQQHDSLKVQGIDALIAFFWLGSRLTPCPFPPQQHLFFTSHEAKETDVASFVKVILGDWVHWREGEESVKKEETKKKIQEKNTNRSPPHHPIYPQDSLSPLPPVADKRSPEEPLTKQNEESVPAPHRASAPPPLCITWHGGRSLGDGSLTQNLE